MRKKAEVSFRDLTNRYGWFRHKYGDVRFCIHCHQPLPKSENAPDFYTASVGEWVEAKNNDDTGTWKCSEIMEGGARENQRKFLTEQDGWLFVEFFGNKEEKAAYLIPWKFWLADIEPKLFSLGMKSIGSLTTRNKDGSIRRLGANDLFIGYSLEWEPKKGWKIPKRHIWWANMYDKILKQLELIAEEMSND